MYLSYLFAVPALFSCAAFGLGNKSLGGKTIVFRNLSTSIYLLHSPIGRIVKFSTGYVMQENVLVDVAISAVLIGVVCFPVYKYKLKPFYGWLV